MNTLFDGSKYTHNYTCDYCLKLIPCNQVRYEQLKDEETKQCRACAKAERALQAALDDADDNLFSSDY